MLLFPTSFFLFPLSFFFFLWTTDFPLFPSQLFPPTFFCLANRFFPAPTKNNTPRTSPFFYSLRFVVSPPSTISVFHESPPSPLTPQYTVRFPLFVTKLYEFPAFVPLMMDFFCKSCFDGLIAYPVSPILFGVLHIPLFRAPNTSHICRLPLFPPAFFSVDTPSIPRSFFLVAVSQQCFQTDPSSPGLTLSSFSTTNSCLFFSQPTNAPQWFFFPSTS